MPPANPSDQAARAELLEHALFEYETRLVGFAATIVSDIERARDAVQDTFIKLYHQDPDAVRENLKAWLFMVCRNRCLDILRKEKRMVHLDPESDWNEPVSGALDPSEATALDDDHCEVLRYLNRLPENQRETIILKFQEGMSYKEIAKLTGLSISNIGFLIHTGLKRIRSLLCHQTTA